jgi:hypothetical protein
MVGRSAGSMGREGVPASGAAMIADAPPRGRGRRRRRRPPTQTSTRRVLQRRTNPASARSTARPGRAAAAAFALLIVGVMAAACESRADGGASFIGGTATSRSAYPTLPTDSVGPSAASPTATPGPTDGPSPSATSNTATETPSGEATSNPTDSSAPGTTTSLTTPSGLSTADETDVPDGRSVCDAVSAEDLQEIFGAPVATKPDRTLASCQFSGGGAQMAVGVYDADSDGLFTIAGQKKSENGGEDLVIAGHPAVLTGDDNLCVSRSTDGSTGGILKIYGLWDTQEVHIGKSLAEKIIPHFTVPDGD